MTDQCYCCRRWAQSVARRSERGEHISVSWSLFERAVHTDGRLCRCRCHVEGQMARDAHEGDRPLYAIVCATCLGVVIGIEQPGGPPLYEHLEQHLPIPHEVEHVVGRGIAR